MAEKIIRSHSLYEVIKLLLPVKKPGLTISEIRRLVPEQFHAEIGTVVRNGCSRGVFESVPATATKPVSYVLTPDANKKYADIQNWKVVERAGQSPKKRSLAAAVSPPEPSNISHEAPPNISREALSLTDQISQVIAQNAHYRQALSDIYTMIGKLLNPPT